MSRKLPAHSALRRLRSTLPPVLDETIRLYGVDGDGIVSEATTQATHMRRLAAYNWCLVACLFLLQQTALADPLQTTNTPSESLDLTSTTRNLPPGLQPGQAVSIQTGDTSRTVTHTDRVTTAEFMAIQQVLAGQQTLLLGPAGNATAGTVHLAPVENQSYRDFQIPAGVTVIRDFARVPVLDLSGTFSNAGAFYALSTSSTGSAIISAGQIVNQQGAILSSVLPSGFATPSVLNLTLSAVHDIINRGTISSSGNLILVAGSSVVNALPAGAIGPPPAIQALGNVNISAVNIVNSGLLAASANINLVGQLSSDLIINNIAGRIEAINGSLNVRDALFTGAANTSITGGDLITRDVNIFGGDGVTDVRTGLLTGILNLTAREAHIEAATPNLHFGSIDISGDPVFISTGNLMLPAATPAQPYIAIAGRDILVNPGFILDTSSNATNGGKVYLFAGANASMTGGTVTITGRSSTGGNVDLTGIAGITTNSTNVVSAGGDVTIVAFAAMAGTQQGGHISIPAGITIQTGQAGTAGAGSLILVADAGEQSGTPSISVGTLNADSSTPGSANVRILSLSPAISPAAPLIIDAATGAILAGSVETGSTQSGGIVSGALSAPGGTITIETGGSISTGVLSTTAGAGSVNLHGGALDLRGDVTANKVTLSALNSGSIRQAAGTTIAAASLDMTSGFGSIGSAAAPITTTATDISSKSSADVFIVDNALSLNLGSSSGANFTLRAPNGKIDLVRDLTVSGNATLSSLSGIKSIEYVESTIPVGLSPIGSAVAPDGRFAYIANAGSNSVSVINTASNTVVKVIPVGAGPIGIAVSPDNSLVYVANSADNTVSQISTATGTVVKTIAVPATPIGVAFSSSGNLAFVTSANAGSVSFIDTGTGDISGAPVAVQSTPGAVAFNRSNGLLYVGNRASNSISVIDPATRTVNNFALSFSPVAFGPCPCGTKIFVADGVSGVHAFSTSLNSVIVSISLPAGSNPSGIGINPTGSLAFVSNAGNGTVSTITTLTNTVSHTTTTGGSPRAFGLYSSFSNGAPVSYVSNATNNSVSVLKTPLIRASQYVLTSTMGEVNVSIGSGTVEARNTNGPAIITSASPIVSTGGQGTAFQLATPLGMTLLGPITGGNIDLHAMNGVFINNSTVTASGVLFFIASPIIQNFGTLSINNNVTASLSLQAPSGMLSVSMPPAGTIRSTTPGNTGKIFLNPAGGSSIRLTGPGSTIAAGQLDIGGNRFNHSIKIEAGQIDAVVHLAARPNFVAISNSTGNLNFDAINVAQNNRSGAYLSLSALAGALNVDSIDAAYSGNSTNSGLVSLYSSDNITISGALSTQAPGATAGAVYAFAAGNIVFTGAASAAIDASGANGGLVSLSAQAIQIAGTNSDGSSISSNGATSPGGYIQVSSLNSAPLQIGTNTGLGSITGSITANGLSGGTIRIHTHGSLNVTAGGVVSANGTTGSGGSIGISGASSPYMLINNGLLQARNTANNSGIIGVSSAPANSVQVTGGGGMQAGSFASFGNLNSVTLLPANPLFFPAAATFLTGGISIQQGSPVENIIAVSGATPAQSAPSAQSDLPITSMPNLNLATLPQVPSNALIPTDKIAEEFFTPKTSESLSANANRGQGTSKVLSIASPEALRTAALDAEITVIDSQSFNLRAGRVLLSAYDQITIKTPLASILVDKGAIVLVNVLANGLAVYDLIDDSAHEVRISSGKPSVTLFPGNACYITSNQLTSLTELTDGVPLRRISRSQNANSLTMFQAEFSLASALSELDVFKKLAQSAQSADRRLLNRVLKTAAALNVLHSGHGPYRKQ